MIEKIIDRVYVTGGIVLLITVIMAMTSCGSVNKCNNNKMVKQYSNW